MRYRHLPLLALALCASQPSGTTAAQQAGGTVVHALQSGGSLMLHVTPGGVVTTVLTRQATQWPVVLAVAPSNRGLVFGEVGGTRREVTLMRFLPGSGVSTLQALPAGFYVVPDLEVDDGGDLLVLNDTGTLAGVFRVPAAGGPITTVASLPGGVVLCALEEDVVTGDLLVFDVQSTIYRVRPNGTVATVSYTPPPSLPRRVEGDVHVDYRTGLVMMTAGSEVVHIDPRNGITTTLLQAPTAGFHGLDADPYGGGFMMVEDAAPALVRYDPVRNTRTTVARVPSLTFGDLVVYGSRMLTGRSRPRLGQAYGLHLSIPSESVRPYVAAAALGVRQGIPLPGGRRIPLDPDALFHLSQHAPALFVGFRGILDAQGTANLLIRVPFTPALAGLRFHVAAATYDGGGIRVVTEPLGVVVE